MPTKFTQKQIAIIATGALVVIIIGVVVFLNIRKSTSGSTAKLVIWGTEDQSALSPMINTYGSAHQGAAINYKRIDPAQYENQLLSALAAGTGPDIFEISSHDVWQWRNVLAPMPATNAEQFTPTTLQNDFPTVVANDVEDTAGNIYALPLSLDTLAMIYNKDLVDAAGIAVLPKTWDDFDSDVVRLRTINAAGQITQAGTALGGSAASIPTATDILYLLMLQNGTSMTTPDFSSAIFAKDHNGAQPGVSALNFYLQFANAGSPYYTWNDAIGNAQDSFIQGQTAIIFDYASSLKTFKQKAPFLNYDVAPMLQPTGATVAVNYPSYSVFVAARYGQVAAAWDFMITVTTNPSYIGLYNKNTGTPSALRSVIQQYASDPAMSVFGAQALTARSWHEVNAEKIDGVMNSAILSVLDGSADSKKALQTAQAGVNDIINSQ